TAKNELGLFEKLNQTTTLSTFGKSWAGLFTGLDKVLMFDKNEIEKFGFEDEMVLPVIRANDCSKFKCNIPQKYVIYPYKYEDGKTILLDESELSRNYPITYNYLIQNKDSLSKRMDSRKKLGEKKNWYSLTRFGQKNIFEKSKIVSPGEVKEHKFCIDESKSGFSCARVFAITIEDESLDLRYCLSLLNSNLVKFFIQKISSPKAGGYFSYSSNILNRVPIKKISLEEQKPFIRLVDEILEKKKLGQETADLENKIDEMVYRLYDLTEEEIAIVEGKK
nr:TaqI-like C-terminal specificity domain-containing protein [Pyrinomonadaceae bacterium]